MQKVGNEASLKKNYPFDIGAELDAGEEPAVPFETAEEIISKYAEIEKRIYYSTYTSENSYLLSFTRWSGEGYASLYDCFISESDCNRLYGELGLSPIDLDGGFKILACFIGEWRKSIPCWGIIIFWRCSPTTLRRA